ncbi:MAG: serine hydrolase [Blautia sp.]|nr:serine hydrolase [Blautia sp.]
MTKRNRLFILTVAVSILALTGISVVYAQGRSVELDAGHQNISDDAGPAVFSPNEPDLTAAKLPEQTGAYTGQSERDMNINLTAVLESILKERGYNVFLTSDDPKASNEQVKAEKAGQDQAGAYVIIHSAHYRHEDAGVRATVMSEENETAGALHEDSLNLAQKILDYVSLRTGRNNLGVLERDDLAEFNWSTVPTVIVEVGSLSSEADDNYLNSDQHLAETAYAIADALDTWFDQKGIAPAAVTEEKAEEAAPEEKAEEETEAAIEEKAEEETEAAPEEKAEEEAEAAPEEKAEEKAEEAAPEEKAEEETEAATEEKAEEEAEAAPEETAAGEEAELFSAAQEEEPMEPEKPAQTGSETEDQAEGTLSAPQEASAFTQQGEGEDRSTIEANFNEIATRVFNLLNTGNGTWAFYMRDIADDIGGNINSHSMQSASLIKLFIMGAVYENYDSLTAAYGKDIIDTKLYDMITVSDNDAANYLVGCLGDGDTQVGMQMVNAYCQQYGYNNTSMGRLLLQSNEYGDNYTSVLDCGKFLNAVYQTAKGTAVQADGSFQDGSSISTPLALPHGSDMFSLLSQQTKRNKIPALLPDGVQVANKTGELGNVENDAGIIYDTENGHDIILVFMSENVVATGEAQNTIAQASAEIYNFYH